MENENQGIGKYRQWFREAVDAAHDWQEAAREDYKFVEGQQWSADELRIFKEIHRPAITVNRIKPLINVLSGYQRLNRYDIEFLGRTPDDVEIAQVRKGITKYIMDRCDYTTTESTVFIDASIGGLGWFFVGYEYDEDGKDGEAFIRREDPFGIYVDPEAHELDYKDAKYICRAKWVDKEELISIYPEHAEEIRYQYSVYDTIEYENAPNVDELLWYKRELNKVRLVECWYKTREKETVYELVTGEEIKDIHKEELAELFYQGMVSGIRTAQVIKIKIAVFFDRILLEDMDSPYEHGELPLVPLTCFYYGLDDELPAGFVRDLKDPQREINRRRIQQLHILNTTGNGGGFIERDAMTQKQFADFERKGSIPGYWQQVNPQAISGGKILERQIGQYPAGVLQAETQATNDLTAISGINEALMGVDVPAQVSGRAIELKQKQAITHIAPLFDNLRAAKKKIAYLLWGKRGKPGIIPQFYTEEKVYRVEGQNGQQFIKVNEQVIERDPLGNAVVSTLNDLSQGEFDIVIADVEASTTQRAAQVWTLLDTVSKLGIPGDIVVDIILDLLDIPQKEELKRRWQQRQESQAQAAEQQMQAQIELERVKNENINQSIAFKDAPLPIQLAMAAKQGLVDPKVAEYAVKLMVEQLYPGLSEQQEQEAIQMQAMGSEMNPDMTSDITPEMQDQMIALAQMQNQQEPQQNQSTMTQAAVESLMRGITPAM